MALAVRPLVNPWREVLLGRIHSRRWNVVGRVVAGAAMVGVLASRALAQQPAGGEADTQMESAQSALRTAKEHLQTAKKNYSGHRKAALQHIDQALAYVRHAMAVR